MIGHNGLRFEHALIQHMSRRNYNGMRSKSRNLWSVVWSDDYGGSCLFAANMRVAKKEEYYIIKNHDRLFIIEIIKFNFYNKFSSTI